MWKVLVYLMRLPLYFIPFMVGMTFNILVVLPLNALYFFWHLILLPFATVYYIANDNRDALKHYFFATLLTSFDRFARYSWSLIRWYFLIKKEEQEEE
ncbi:MAG: hypothetical protein PHY31_09300 [Smithellaceae bacterium]|nr:hypothetical protein [Smithellaceae bacterium]